MPGPFTRSSSATFKDILGNNIPKETVQQTWWTSSKKPGKRELDLKPQPFSRHQRHNMTYWQSYNPQGFVVNLPTLGIVTSNEPQIAVAFESLYNQAYSRFWSKVKGDTASLGMDIASWRQSWGMIKLANDRLYSYAKDAAVEANRRNRNGKRLKAERASDVFLEYQFGWVPLLEDIINTASVLAQAAPTGWYKGSANTTISLPDGIMSDTRKETGRVAVLREKITAKVEVSNPNLWIANQLGLINPAQILWDRIPWSFLVGAFVNVNQLLNSFTNDWGLSVTEVSDTKTIQLFDSVWGANTYPTNHPFYATAHASAMQRFKSRSVGPMISPKLKVGLPKLSMTTGLIASSLATQQIRRLRK